MIGPQSLHRRAANLRQQTTGAGQRTNGRTDKRTNGQKDNGRGHMTVLTRRQTAKSEMAIDQQQEQQ